MQGNQSWKQALLVSALIIVTVIMIWIMAEPLDGTHLNFLRPATTLAITVIFFAVVGWHARRHAKAKANVAPERSACQKISVPCAAVGIGGVDDLCNHNK